MNELTPNANMIHQCFICSQTIDELKKASFIEVGIGQRLAGHDKCLAALDAEISYKEAEADAAEASFLAKAKEEVANGLMDWLINDIGMKEVTNNG